MSNNDEYFNCANSFNYILGKIKMKKRIIIICIMLFCELNIFAQQYSRDVIDKKPTIDEFNYWKRVYEFNTQKTGKVNTDFIKDMMKADTSEFSCLIDSIKMQMKVLNIIKLDNFYTLDNKKIRKIDVYCIWVAPLFNGEIKKTKFHFMEKEWEEIVSYMVLSVSKNHLQKSTEIKKGETYEFLLSSFFSNKLSSSLYSGTVFPLYIDNACNLTYPIAIKGDFYTTPNLNGLYYIDSK